MVPLIGITTLHSFGEVSGVQVSFAGSKGLSQVVLVTIAIIVHNIPEGLALSMVMSSHVVSPTNALIWSVITSLPQVRIIFKQIISISSRRFWRNDKFILMSTNDQNKSLGRGRAMLDNNKDCPRASLQQYKT